MFKATDAIDAAEVVYEWLRALREEADASAKPDLSNTVTEAILSIGSALESVERACEAANK